MLKNIPPFAQQHGGKFKVTSRLQLGDDSGEKVLYMLSLLQQCNESVDYNHQPTPLALGACYSF